VLHKQIEKLLGSPLTVAIALIVGGLAIIGIERTVKEGNVKGVADIPLPKVIAIGFIQCLAMIPGVSRSGATILGALSLGVERRTAAEFSFFLAIPTMLGATVLELVTKRHELMAANSVGFGLIAVGFVVAFVVALVVVKWFVGLVGRTGFSPFGWYRIAVGALALVFLLK
jgi:undecaprenyl-diphosphatase